MYVSWRVIRSNSKWKVRQEGSVGKVKQFVNVLADFSAHAHEAI